MLLITQRLLHLKSPTIQDYFTIIYFLHVIYSVLSMDTVPSFALLFFRFLTLKIFPGLFNQRGKVLDKLLNKAQ